MNSRRHLVLGAARSAKTRFALNVAQALAREHEREVIYVATAEAHDAEMRERIARHRAERPSAWRTLEAPRDLARALASIKRQEIRRQEVSGTFAANDAPASSEATAPVASASTDARASTEALASIASASVIIVDCLTLWLSNALLCDFREDHPTGTLPTWAHERETFMRWLEDSEHTLVLVSNEVGGGIVPASALARRFQSEQGWLNQDVAAVCEHVTLVVAGLPVTIKAPR
jgi:adenosylcobinamide kinase/adenosylcobinamide-phosphate guanylyltransferase